MAQQQLWQECRDWLLTFKLKLMSRHFETLFDVPSVLDFAYHLRDGVILCNLLYCLDSKSIHLADVCNNARVADFLCHKNIGLFLRVCRTYFRLPESDLFEASMLYDYTNFYKVLRTLKKLSNCAKVQQRSIRGFGQTSVQFNKDRDDNIYATISEYASHDDYSEWKKNQDKRTDSSEKIYDNVMGQNTLKTAAKHANKRKFHVDELITSEQNYVNILDKFVDIASTYVTNAADRADLFPGVFGMHKLHKELLERLKCFNRTTGRLSEAFLERIDDLYVYKDYFCNLETATKLLEQRKTTDRHFSKAVREFTDSNNGIEIEEMFKVPFQRLLKYRLLIEAIVKATPEHHPDMQSLIEAAESVHDIVQCMDSMRCQRDSFNIIENIQKHIYDHHITEEMSPEEYGSLYVSSNLKVYSYETNKTELMYVFLFDTVLLFCSSMTKNTDLSFRRIEALDHTFMEEIKDKPNGWRLKGKEDNKYDMFAVEGLSAEKWKNQLKYVLSRLNVKSNHLLRLHSFIGLSRCSSCKKMLRGIYYQGYHCKLCYSNFHEQCLKHSKSCSAIQERLQVVDAVIGYETSKLGHLSIRKGEKIVVDLESNKEKPFVKVSTLDGMEGFVSWTCIGKEFSHCASERVKDCRSQEEPNDRRTPNIDAVHLLKLKICNESTESIPPQLPEKVHLPKPPRKVPIPPCEPASKLKSCRLPKALFGPQIPIKRNPPSPQFPAKQDHISKQPLPSAHHTLPPKKPLVPPRPKETLATAQKKIPFYTEVIHPQSSGNAASASSKSKKKCQMKVEEQVQDFPWKYGSMNRREAERRLDQTAVGTFLVRFSTKEQMDVLSVKAEDQCRHMQIITTNDKVKLSEERTFSSLRELIEHYMRTSLEESFDKVDVTLEVPFSDVKFYMVKNRFSSEDGSDTIQVLDGNVGDIIALHDKQPFQGNEHPGWWLGGLNNHVGLFHESDVEEVVASQTLFLSK